MQAFQGLPAGNLDDEFTTIDVLFNLPIDLSSVLPERFTIYKDGLLQPGSVGVELVSVDLKLFRVSGLENILSVDGTYEMRVDVQNIRSTGQVFGMQQQSVSLTLDNSGPLLVSLLPSVLGGLDPQHITFVDIQFNEAVVGFNTAAVELARDGVPLPLNIAQLTLINGDWKAGSCGMLTYPDGEYTFTVTLSSVSDVIGNVGVGTEQVTWTVDRSSTITISNLAIDPDLGHSNNDGVTSNPVLEVLFELNAAAAQVTLSQVSFGSEHTLSTVQNVQAGAVSIPVVFPTGGNTVVKVVATGTNGGSSAAQRNLFIDQTPLSAQWLFASNQSLQAQVATVQLSFSAKLLDDSGLLPAIQFKRNGVLLPADDLGLDVIDDTGYSLTGLDITSGSPGNYELSVDLTPFRKHTSGKQGSGLVSVSWTVQPSVVPVISVRMLLQGPYDTQTGLMKDDLRIAGLLPVAEPYSGLAYLHAGGGGGETAPASVFAITGPDAIVDWVVMEFRSAGDPTVVLYTRSLLLQRDGDVVDTLGASAITPGVPAGNYFPGRTTSKPSWRHDCQRQADQRCSNNGGSNLDRDQRVRFERSCICRGALGQHGAGIRTRTMC
ncbi:MAG: hypothetical protein IPG92_18510 [Flavobacteriales bacterium]|nr:hypothetical protein [Flavobacteriales bacterium]